MSRASLSARGWSRAERWLSRTGPVSPMAFRPLLAVLLLLATLAPHLSGAAAQEAQLDSRGVGQVEGQVEGQLEGQAGALSAGMVAAANPHAAEAGLSVLRRGGVALDAAVAVQSVLGLVEPHSSGLGGGAFLLYWDAADQSLHAYDGRETAPAAADPEQFLRPDGTPM